MPIQTIIHMNRIENYFWDILFKATIKLLGTTESVACETFWDVKSFDISFVWIVLGSESRQFEESKDLLNYSKVGIFANFSFDL